LGKLNQNFINLTFPTEEQMGFIKREGPESGKRISNPQFDINQDIFKRFFWQSGLQGLLL
jgi:hypothetical protein